LNQRPPSSSSDFAKTAIGVRAVQLFHHRADANSASFCCPRRDLAEVASGSGY
jgi:hypothetical protein